MTTYFNNYRFANIHIYIQLILIWIFFSPLMGYGQNEDLRSNIIERRSGSIIEANVIVGFDPDSPQRREMAWVPVHIDIDNGDEAIQGQIEVKLKNGQETYSTPVNQAPKTRKSYSLFVFIPDYLDELEFYLVTSDEQLPLEIITVSPGLQKTTKYLAILTNERGLQNHIVDSLYAEDLEFVDLLYTEPRLLPKAWVGYQNIDALLWDNHENFQLSPEQSEALETWIQMGGTLILASGEAWQQLNESPFQLYVPVKMNGSSVLPEGAQLTCPVDNSKAVLDSSTVITDSQLEEDDTLTVWLQHENQPFLVEKKWGAGSIFWLASNLQSPILQNDLQEEKLLTFLMESFVTNNTSAVSQTDSITIQFLRWLVQAELPSTQFIAMYLGLYIIIVVPINYLIFRAVKRLEWAWFTVPIWAIIFAYGAYYIGALRQEGHVSVNQISVVEALSGANVGQSTTYSSIYSPVRRWYTLEFADPMAFPMMQMFYNQRGSNISIDETLNVIFNERDHTQINDFLIYHWSSRVLKTQHQREIGDGVEIDFVFENDRAHATISNHSGFTLYDPQVVVANYTFRLESLNDGDTVQVDRNLREMTPYDIQQQTMNSQRWNMYSMPGRVQPREADRLIDDYLKGAYPVNLLNNEAITNHGIFLAHIKEPMLNFVIQDEPINPSGDAMISVIFPYKYNYQGRLELNPGDWRLITKGMVQNQRYPGINFGEDIISINPSFNNKWDYVSKVPLEGASVENMYIRVNYNQFRFSEYNQNQPFNQSFNQQNSIPPEFENHRPSTPEHELQVLNLYTNTFQPLSNITHQNGALLNPDLYVNKISGLVSMKMKILDNHNIIIPASAIQIHASLNYGKDAVPTFLGEPIIRDSVNNNGGY